jgi:hypothetical protein
VKKILKNAATKDKAATVAKEVGGVKNVDSSSAV